MLLRSTSFLFAFVMVVLLASPVLAINISESPQLDNNRYQIEIIEVVTMSASTTTTSATTKKVAQVSATLNGFLKSLGPYAPAPTGSSDLRNPIYVWFELTNGLSTIHTKMTAPGPFNATIKGLTPDTPYQFRAVASSLLLGGQQAEGDYVLFHTAPDTSQTPLLVSTISVSDVTPGTAVLHGYLSTMEPYNEVKVWFNWGVSAAYGNTAGEQVLHAAGPFSIQISGLKPNNIYYFRAGAVPAAFGAATVYGDGGSFITRGAGNLAVSTWTETNVKSTSATLTGNLPSIGPYTSANVWFEWGTTAAYGQVTPLQTMHQTGIFTYSLQDLAAGTTYHYRAVAMPNSIGGVVVYGLDNEFTTMFLPGIAVSTEPVIDVTANSAVFSGLITPTDLSSEVSAWFEYGTDTNFGNNTPRRILNTPGNFKFTVTDLSPGTNYYFRAAASSDGYTAHGQYNTFSTRSTPQIMITTSAASELGPSSATLNAFINSLGSTTTVQVFFNFGKSPEYGMSTLAQTCTSTGPVSAPASRLTEDTIYYFQAVAQTADGNKIYGSQETFRTVSTPEVAVTTYPATNITNSSATLNGNIDHLGSVTLVQAWFEYGTIAEFGNSTVVMTLGSPAPFSSNITALPGTTYYYRAVALNPADGGSSILGATVSFVTVTSPPETVPSPGEQLHVWFSNFQRFVGIELERLSKSLNKYLGK